MLNSRPIFPRMVALIRERKRSADGMLLNSGRE
jgi:hypothetical protein